MKINDIINEALNPELGRILALANQFAVAVANMKIYDDDIFANHLKIGGLGTMVDWYKQNYTEQNYADARRQAMSAKQALDQLDVRVDYNESFPTDFTLTIPGQSRPYTFNIIEMLKSTMATFQDKGRAKSVKEVAASRAWNPNTGEIYEAANTMAIALYGLAILTNPAFRKREDPQGRLYAVLDARHDPDDFEETAELSERDLAEYGARLAYNANYPRVFTLHVPKQPPHQFDIKEVIDSSNAVWDELG